MSWRVAESLKVLRKQVDAERPDRDRSSDGSIGDAAHASRTSDHNPYIKDANGVGVVRAIDITHDPHGGFDSYAFADMLRINRDPRIRYIISNRRISSPDIQRGAWRPYSGSNPHDHHVHISVREEPEFYDSTEPWKLDKLPPATQPPAVAPPKRPTLKIGSTGKDVEYLQRMLGLPVTGLFDIPTETKVKEFQARYGLTVDGRVGPYTWRQLEA